ncbi:hypothetical protein [Novosphingobium sp. SG707]|uniref:hypothetical protein n=1 Tax=Novosphingobium sp. SG707 TaxID=2586996 RepID=UPI001829781B|nr:hypothetical protein [Novosphingobium sp. SG707]NKJ00722.1 hypothetical protein [Novosphingobium sp. SG707]
MPVLGKLIFLLMMTGTSLTSNENERQCSVKYSTVFVSRIEDLPEEIQKDILKDGEVANPRKPFQAYDVIQPGLPNRRLVLAGHSGDRWFVWIDHGGYNRHDDVLGFSQLWEKVDVFRWFRAAELQGEPCIGINAFLDGVGTPARSEH